MARLARNVTLEQAQADMDVIAAWLAREFPRPNAKEGALVEPIREHIVGEVRTPLVVITGAALLVLLIGCVNVANLQLARGLTRRREISVRMALGAGRLRIVAQLLTESMILAIIGGALGLLVAVAGVEAFRYVLPPALQSIAEPEIDGRLLAFAALMALGTGVLFGLAPAVQTSSLTPGVADGSRSAGSAGGTRVRQILVAAEIALALVLLVGSGLLLRSFTRLSSVDPGFATDQRLTFRVELPRGRYGEPAQWAPFLDSLVERIESLPGVRAAGGTSWLPLTESGGSNAIFVEGRPLPAPGQALFATYRLATPHYFRAAGIPLLQGRTFDDTDGLGSPRITVINRTMATRLWPGEDPIGKRVTFARAPGPTDWITVVGVIGDAKLGGLAAPVSVAMYSAHTQEPYWTPPSHFVVHTTGDPLAMAATIREQVRALDPRLPVSDVKTMSAILREHVSAPRFQSVLIGAFGATALVLAWIGIYGLLAFAVASRRREIGVRTALGASPREIVRMVLASGARIAGAGLGIGLLAAFLLSRWLETLLFEIEPADAPTFAASASAMIALALLACYVPARRAARVDPVSALKSE